MSYTILMFYKLSKFFIYASLLSPLLLVKVMFFPFIAGKAIFFRGMVDLALLCFALHLLSHIDNREFWQRFVAKLKHPLIICVAVFAILFTLTALIGVNPTQSFWSNFERGEGAFQILHYALFFIMAALLFTDKKSIERLLIVNIVVSVPMCIYAFLQLITPIESGSAFVIAPGERVSGTLGNPSYLAAYLIFILAFLLYFFIKYKDPSWRVLIGLLFAFEFYIFLNTGTRGAFIGVVVAMLLLAAINFLITRDRHIRLALGAIFIVIVALTGTFFLTRQAKVWQNVPVLSRLINFNSALNDIRPRLWTWGSAVSGTLERPVTGWGAENFAEPFDKYYNPKHYGIESFFDRTHNIFLEYSISGGLLVLLPWLAIFWFYYQRLNRRPKDFWYSILFVTPIAYLVQGFFLFDTLPIYLVFFIFLVLSMNTEGQEIHLLPEKGSGLRGANTATAALLAVGCGALLYYTAVIPLQKNNLLVEALVYQNTLAQNINAGGKLSVSPAQVIERFHIAMEYKSVVGQEEAVGMYQKFALNLLENASRDEKLVNDPQVRAEIRILVDDANRWYDANKGIYPGLKEQYINGGINLRAGQTFRHADYLARGREMFLDALSKAPTRLEFINVIIELAQLENDTVTLDTWSRRAAFYRPDIFKLQTIK